jgi:LPS-assembly lipoprotein
MFPDAWSTWWREAMGKAGGGRRGFLGGAAGVLALGLGGCGFQPVYSRAPAATGGDPSLADEMAATRVALIPNRFGQMLRRSLQNKLGSVGAGAPAARWELVVGPSQSGEGVGIQQDGAATRVRTIATANWTLLRMSPRETVASGFERAIDAYNIQPNQYFAADSSRDAMERRLADLLANEVIMRVAARFRGMQEGQPARLVDPVEQLPPMSEPTVQPMMPGVGGQSLGSSPAVQGGLDGGIGPVGGFR